MAFRQLIRFKGGGYLTYKVDLLFMGMKAHGVSSNTLITDSSMTGLFGNKSSSKVLLRRPRRGPNQR